MSKIYHLHLKNNSMYITDLLFFNNYTTVFCMFKAFVVDVTVLGVSALRKHLSVRGDAKQLLRAR